MVEQSAARHFVLENNTRRKLPMGNIKVYGYMRVSTREQKEDRQLAALLGQGVARKNIYMDKQSGKDFERPQYKKCFGN